MSARVTTAVDEDGQVLACKRATDAEDALRLRREAEVLDRAQHPGVVELVGCREVDGVVTLYTSFVGAHTLETSPPLPLNQAGAVVAMLAATVSDLHDLGIVHGRIDPSHVLLGPARRPILCGFTGAGDEGEVAPPGPGATAEFRDPAVTLDAPLIRSCDVYALGALLRVLVISDATDIEPIPERRFTLRRGRPWTGYLRRALLTLADQCTDDQPLRRPSARRLAADIGSLLPASNERSRRPGQSAVEAPAVSVGDQFETLRPTADDDTHTVRGRRTALAATALGLILVFWGLTSLRSNDTTAAPTQTTTHTQTQTSDPISAAPASAPDVHLVANRTVSVDGNEFTIGDPGDHVALGDWRCDGRPTAALVRPSTGEVFVFDGWPSADGSAVAMPLQGVTAAVDLRAENQGSCSVLYAVRADGTETEVKVP